MPRISAFYGIAIYMYFDEKISKLPHFHSRYGDDWAVFLIDDLKIIEGQLPKTAMKIVRRWAKLHKEELMNNYRNMQEDKPRNKIDPLD
jgi:hypothetical protein